MAQLCLSSRLLAESPPKTINPLSSEHKLLQLERQAVRKLDFTILPVMAIFELILFLDRSNIGNARVAGLQKDLHMTDIQYQICITVLYVPFILIEIPSNLLLRKIGPRLLMPTLLTTWGIIVTLQGFVKSYAGLVTARAFLGVVEGPMAPAIVLYLSGFYTRKELSLRVALFLTSAPLSGAISGFLAAAIEDMNGIGGKPGWAWIFILEGLLSVLIGLIGFFLVPSTPCDSKFLTEDQKDIIMRRLERDRPSIKPIDTFSFKEVLRSLLFPQVVIGAIIFFFAGSMVFGLALFLPSIVNQLGFSPNKTQLLSIGPYMTAFFISVFTAFLSDRYQSRGIPTAVVSMLAAAGFALYLAAEHKFTSYGALYLMAAGAYSIAPVLASWMANNSEPYYRRAAIVGLAFTATNSGGLLSSWSYPTKDGPKFRNTTIMNLIFSILIVVCSLINIAYLSWKNKVKKRPGEYTKMLEKYVATNEGDDDGGLNAWMELGDQHPDFVYTL